MFKWVRKIFTQDTPKELAVRELVAAKRAKLEAETARDYAVSIVAYNEARIARLEEYVKLN